MAGLEKRLRRILNGPAGVTILVVILFFLQVPYSFGVIPLVLAVQFKVRFVIALFLLFCLIVLGGGVKAILKREILLWLCLGWSLLMCVSMHLNGKPMGEIITLIKDPLLTSWIAVLLLSVYSKVNARRLIAVLFAYYLVLNTLNNASVMFFRNTGLWVGAFAEPNPEYVFFGHINEGLICGLNSILFGSIYCLKYARKWLTVHWINLSYSVITALVIDCVDQIFVYLMAIAVMVVCLLHQKKAEKLSAEQSVKQSQTDSWRLLKFVNFRNIMILNVVLMGAIVVLVYTGWIEKTGMYSLLHGRQELWGAVLGSIREHPVLGNGYTSWFEVMMHYGNTKFLWHQHSFYFQVLYETGIVGAALYVLMFIRGIRSSKKNACDTVRLTMEVLIGVFFLALLVEVCLRSEIFLLLGALCYLPEQINSQEQVSKQAR